MANFNAKAKKEFKMPHTLVIIGAILLFAVLMTWIIPAGSYTRVEKVLEDGSTVKMVDPATFEYVEAAPVNPLDVPMYIVEAFIENADLIFVILFAGGAFYMLTLSGALQAVISKVAKKFSNKLYIFIPMLTLVFAVICTTQGVNTFIAFAPVMVMLSLAMGLDSITGVAIILLGGAVGFSTGTLNINTTIVAQKIAEVPLYSGIEFRTLSFVVFYIVTNIYLVRYAMKIQKNRQLSPMYDLDLENEAKELDLDSFGTLDTRKVLVILSLVVALACIVYGAVFMDWDLEEQASAFLTLAVVVGLFAGFTPSTIAKNFVEGAKKMLAAAFIIGLARAIGTIMTDGKIVDTVVYSMAGILNAVPTILQAPAMFIANIIINIFLTSGSGQASAVMPIMAPLGDLIEMSRQTVILTYNFGDGFCNYILPTSTALMGILSAANVPYDRWMKFMWKLFLIWIVIGSILVSIAHMINLGPV